MLAPHVVREHLRERGNRLAGKHRVGHARCALALIIAPCGERVLAKQQDRDQIDERHQPHAGIGHRPHERQLPDAAEHHHAEHREPEHQQRAAPARDEADVAFRIRVVADHRRKREEEDRHRHVDASPVADVARDRALRERRAGHRRARLVLPRQQDHERGRAADHDRVDEHAEHLDQPLRDRMPRARGRGRVRRAAHAGLVREQAAFHADRHRLAHRVAGQAARRLLEAERALHDQHDHVRHERDVRRDRIDREREIADRHHGHDHLRDVRDPPNPAEDDRRRQRDECEPDGGAAHAERRVERLGDRVRLHRVEHEAEREDQRQREQHAETARAQPDLDVIRGAAAIRAVMMRHLEDLRERRLDERGRHPDERRHPHPEDRARPAHRHRNRDARDVARADAAREPGRERLERRDAARLALAADEAHAEEQRAQLNHPEAQREPRARAEQQRNQHVIPENAVDPVDQRTHKAFHPSSPDLGSDYVLIPVIAGRGST
ncbi:hypothetical protein BURPS1710b_3714 [Burkholderia pseudomallei 1710b]|uniref:Uncharacterized protein n=1 Tax=Burkholderia pseudomallei (strain 1710b) TaxID=320372 RepID=Q3JMX5_BURP1|nr:hypothetical protein BURPS1710b_3714 [Burkholderia pseudomallei 1710b]